MKESAQPVVAFVTREEYLRIHRYCQEHDVKAGGIYDAPSGGAINVWSRESWETPEGGVHCTFLPKRLDGKGFGEVLEELMEREVLLAVASEGRAGGGLLIQDGFLGLVTAGCKWIAVVFLSGTHGEKGTAKDWTLEQAREHFAALYQSATGSRLSPSRISREEVEK